MKGLRFAARWFSSRTYRSALDEYRRTRTQLRRQGDRITEEGRGAITEGLRHLREGLANAEPPFIVRERRDALRTTAYQWLEDPRRNRLKDGTEMILTAVVVVLALRTFFAQPMEVPSSSMQPTLWGVTIENLLRDPDREIPPTARRWFERLWWGRTYYHIVAKAPGRLTAAEPPRPLRRWLSFLPTLREQRFQIGEVWYSVILPRLELPNPVGLPPEFLFVFHAGVDPDRVYQAGEDIAKLAVTTGDHLLIDRFTINFRRLRRGEIIVFRAYDIPKLREAAHYLKRLVAFGGETVQIGDDRHLRIDGVRLDQTTPYFSDLYDFRGPPVDGAYSGHLHDGHARLLRMKPGFLAPLFPDGQALHRVAPHQVFVLGDNSVASYDSRRFGDLPETAIVGRLLGVYWPFSPRFGFSVQ